MIVRRAALLAAFFVPLLVPLSASAQPPASSAKPAVPAKPKAAASAATSAKPPAATTAKHAAGAAPATAPTTHAVVVPPPVKLDVKLDVRRKTLANGLRVVMAPDSTSPTVAVDVVYDVGSRVEERGHSGFAHLFEHMMFQGSANVPKGEHFKLVTSHGGTLNGTTNQDRTNYFEMLPRSELPLALWLEADRLKSLDVSEANFENQRAVVKEEYRMRVENAAYVPAEIRLQELVYQGYWPYEHSTIGSMRDLDAAQIDWVRAFHTAYYAPNNAVLSIAGDFDPDEAMTLVEKFFGPAKTASTPTFDEAQQVPPQTAPRDEVVEDAHAKLPAYFDGWPIPKTRTPEHYALELAGMILTDGESSRLYRSLVRERAVAVGVQAGTNDFRGPDWFELDVKLATGAKLPDVEKVVDWSLGQLATKGPTESEMNKAKTRFMSHFVMGLQSNFARAQKLAEFEVYWGDADLLNQEAAKYLAVTAADVKAAVAKYLVKEHRSRVEVRPGADSAAPPPAPPPASPPPPKATAVAPHGPPTPPPPKTPV
ncbi:MAG: pitrilysin family protein, partial [Polyangiaceae bacterium]